jgi:predicted HicB family RNase H-like nuclease
MTRINIEIPEKLHKKLKIEAVSKNKALKDYLVELLGGHK